MCECVRVRVSGCVCVCVEIGRPPKGPMEEQPNGAGNTSRLGLIIELLHLLTREKYHNYTMKSSPQATQMPSSSTRVGCTPAAGLTLWMRSHGPFCCDDPSQTSEDPSQVVSLTHFIDSSAPVLRTPPLPAVAPAAAEPLSVLDRVRISRAPSLRVGL